MNNKGIYFQSEKKNQTKPLHKDINMSHVLFVVEGFGKYYLSRKEVVILVAQFYVEPGFRQINIHNFFICNRWIKMFNS